MTKLPAEPIQAPERTGGDYVAAGFFFAFDLATVGNGSGPRSIEDKRPAVKV